MKAGIQLIFPNHRDYSDAEMYENEIKLAIEAEAMGYNVIGCVEHHFDDYSMCPDNAQFLSYLAAKTKTIKLMPAAFILPWNDPLRVVEKTVMLDIMSEGRAVLGMGRGLARKEFVGLRSPMAEARDRFDEAIVMILNGLETGYVEGNGKFYKQPRVEIRPRPVGSFKDRAYMVSMSPSSAAVATRLGVGCFKFPGAPWEDVKAEVDVYREGFLKVRNKPAPPIICADFISIDTNLEKAKQIRNKYLVDYGYTVISHYEMNRPENFQHGSHSSYLEAAKGMKDLSDRDQAETWAQTNIVGTPEMIIENLAHRRSLIGDFDIVISFSCGSQPYDLVRQQMKLFAEKVMPVIAQWPSVSAGQAAAQ